MPGSDAVLQERDGRWALCFERLLGEPPERVWRALTTHEELFDWHPTPSRIASRPRATPPAGTFCLDALSSSLAGVSRPQRGAGPRVPDGWSELNSDYQERFGISARESTPPPPL